MPNKITNNRVNMNILSVYFLPLKFHQSIYLSIFIYV